MPKLRRSLALTASAVSCACASHSRDFTTHPHPQQFRTIFLNAHFVFSSRPPPIYRLKVICKLQGQGLIAR
eukprot:7998803-Prorocentrum_lima.AAC.1